MSEYTPKKEPFTDNSIYRRERVDANRRLISPEISEQTGIVEFSLRLTVLNCMLIIISLPEFLKKHWLAMS